MTVELNVTDPMGNVWNHSCCYFPSVKNKILLQNGKSDFYEEDGRHMPEKYCKEVYFLVP